MGDLNSIGTMLAAKNDLWQNLISWFGSWVINFGWAIVVFTICLKLVMIPLDIWQRSASAKQQKVTTIMQPEMAKLQEKYGNDREKLNQETAKLYKKYNVSLGGMCGTMLVTMGVSLVVFFTLFGSLKTFGDRKLYENYKELDDVCVAKQAEAVQKGYAVDSENYNTYVKDGVLEVYKQQQEKHSWLWVKNVWKGDVNTNQLADLDGYVSTYDLKDTDDNKAKTNAEKRYNIISNIVEKENPGQNGYYVLVIASAVISLLTQFLSTKLLTPKGQKMTTVNYVMFAVIPVTMVILVLNSNVVFALYTITNSIMTALVSTITTLITKNKNKNQPEEVLFKKKNVEVVEYSRNYKK